MRLKEFENARRAFARCCELEDDYGPSWADLGLALAELKKPVEAIAAAKKAIALQGEFPGGHGAMGRALMIQKKFKEALPHLTKCEQLSTMNPAWKIRSTKWIAECKKGM